MFGDDAIKMQCTLNISKKLLLQNKRGIAYKYVIHSRNRKNEDTYEHIHHIHPKFQLPVNRSLVVPEKRMHKGK